MRLTLAMVVICGVSACSLDSGINVTGNVDDLQLSVADTAGRDLFLGVWLGRQPGALVRPDDAVAFEQVQVNRTTEDPLAINTFIWSSSAVQSELADVYVGAFYEPAGFADGVPDPAAPLAVAGPIAVTGGKIENITIRFLPSAGQDVPTVAETVAELKSIFERGDVAAFDALVHPFYGDPWNRGVETIGAWLAAGQDGPVPYTDPVSAPLAAFLSTAVRDEIGLRSITFGDGELINENQRTAQLEVNYTVSDKFNFALNYEEAWRLAFVPSNNELLLGRWFVRNRAIDGFEVRLAGTPAAGNNISIDWTDPERPSELARFEFRFDRFRPETGTWENLFARGVTSSANRLTIGNGDAPSVLIPSFSNAEFYRARIWQVFRDGFETLPSEIYVVGEAYPFDAPLGDR